MSDSAGVTITPDPSQSTEGTRAFRVSRVTRALCDAASFGAGPDRSMADYLCKAVGDEKLEVSASNQGILTGRRAQPANFSGMSRLMQFNGAHASCIVAKKHATVGLGLVSDKATKALDPLCDISFQMLMSVSAEDFHSTGNGYLEVVRAKQDDFNGPVLGMHWFPSPSMWIAVAPDGLIFFEMDLQGTITADQPIGLARFPKFGTAKRFYAHYPSLWQKIPDGGTYSEVIHIPFPTALNRWYGLPNWLAAVPLIELQTALNQREFDFFNNRGVPEFMLFITGATVSDKSWRVIENAIQSSVGMGNSHKSIAVNIPEPAEIRLEKLDLEGTDQGARFELMTQTLSLGIVSAHQVPPLLAGIQIPGKMGASNELPNAIRAFQALTMSQAQLVFSTVLGNTLGNPAKNGGLSLGPDDFKFKPITDEFDLNIMDTSTRMRQTEGEAAAEGRDMTAGLKKELTEEQAHDLADFLAYGIKALRSRRGAA